MGSYRHHVIVVTSSLDSAIEEAHVEALRVFAGTMVEVTPITVARINHYRSFFVAPDGGKEGRETSDRADAAREQFVAWLRDAPNSGYSDWIEVNFGGDDPDMIGARGVYGSLWAKANADDPEW